MKLNNNIAELIGVIIGDGCIRYKPHLSQYYIEIVGDKNNEKEYFEYIKKMFIEELNLNAFIKVREGGLRLKVYSKTFIEFLVYKLKLPNNKDKCQNIFIPDVIFNNKNLLISCLRGIMDTDGSLFLTNKGHRKNYPTIEISTTSQKLARQLKNALKVRFRIGFRSYKPGRFHRIYRISLNGDKMIEKWYQEIGFSNLRNLNKHRKYKEKWGYGDLNPEHLDV